MLGWLWLMIVGRFSNCDHVWKIIDQKQIRRSFETGTRFILQCEKCGDVKKRDVI